VHIHTPFSISVFAKSKGADLVPVQKYSKGDVTSADTAQKEK
jgi:hypothetical protein